MNKRRIGYLLALLLIIAALVVPAVVRSNHSDSKPVAETTVSRVKIEKRQSTAQVSPVVNEPVQTPASTTDGDTEPKEAVPGQAAKLAAPLTQCLPEKQGCKVGIAIVGRGGELLYVPASVTVKSDNKWGITPLGALDVTGLTYAMKPAWPDFVDSISGQACQGVSGWMYMVNGEIPMHMADKHPIKEGDQVIWWYSESMDQAPPIWAKLGESKN